MKINKTLFFITGWLTFIALGVIAMVQPETDFLQAVLLGAVAGGVGTSTTIQLTYLPQYIGFTAASTPQSIRVTVLGDGTSVDLDENGIDQLNGFETFGLATNQYTLPLADGLIKGKNVEITIVGNNVAGFNLYGWNKAQGRNYFVYQRQTILANSGVRFNKFGLLAVASPGADDQFRVTYQDGTVDDVTLNEIQYDVSYFQNGTGVTLINNLDQIVKDVNIIPSAQRVAYLMRFQPAVGELDNAPVTST